MYNEYNSLTLRHKILLNRLSVVIEKKKIQWISPWIFFFCQLSDNAYLLMSIFLFLQILLNVGVCGVLQGAKPSTNPS